MILRKHQTRGIELLRKAMARGHRRVLVVMPTGGGKTIFASEIVRRAVEKGHRVLWLAHRSELIDQAASALQGFGLTVGAICASSSVPPNPFAPVQVASPQTLISRNVRPEADLIVPDEAHHFCAAAESFSSLLQSYPKAYVVGLTATPERGDGHGLGSQYEEIVVASTVKELTTEGLLVPCEIVRPKRPLRPGEIAQNPIDAYKEHAPGRPTILFARSVMLAEQYASEFTMAGISAKAISVDTPWAQRRTWIDAFKQGEIKVLTSVNALTEGFDAPQTSCVILARGCGSSGLYLQMIGRGLRPATGKENCILLDLRGVSHEHGKPDADREYSLDGKGIVLKDPNSYCQTCGMPPDACACPPISSDETGKVDTVTGDPLEKWAAFREEADDKRAKRLAKWLLDAEDKGHKSGAAKFKFQAVYGKWPNGAVMSEAMALVQVEKAKRGAA